jgi:hypothetical protein
MKNRSLYFLLLSLPAFINSCTKENREPFESEVVKQWTIAITAKNELPSVAGITDTGTVNFQLYSDNTIRYELTVKNISNSDVLTGAHLSAGDPVTNGNTVLDLTPTSKFTSTIGANTYAYGVVNNVRQSLVDSLMNNNNNFYFELYSRQHTSGLARGQLNMRIEFTADIALNGALQVPPVNTTATGTTWLRLTTDRKLYSRITIANNEANDPFTMAHIHRAAIGFNGPVVITLASAPSDFNSSKLIVLDQALNNILINDSRLYVNAHSTLYPDGKIRGQIRN